MLEVYETNAFPDTDEPSVAAGDAWDGLSDDARKCRELWLSVVANAVAEMRLDSEAPRAKDKCAELRYAREQAIKWIFGQENADSFRQVCEWAGLDPAQVRRATRNARRAISKSQNAA